MKGVFLLAATVIASCAEETDARRSLRPFEFPPDPQECSGANEEWMECVSGSCAEASCEKRVVGPICTADCRYGCFCSDGFYRNAEGHCVTLDQCPPEYGRGPSGHPPCGPNEEWKVCVSSSCAEPTCKIRAIGPICTADCRNGCFCSMGFYRNAAGSCVPEDECSVVDTLEEA